MFKFLLAPFLAVYTLFSPNPNLFDVVDDVSKSVVMITGERDVIQQGHPVTVTYTCTGFVYENIPTVTITLDKVITAEHCIGRNLRVNGTPAIVLAINESQDLALILTDTGDMAPVRLRLTPVEDDEQVNAIGYGFGNREPIITFHTVLRNGISPHPTMPLGVLYRGRFIGGMSGGPVFDRSGKVVGIIQRSSEVDPVGFGVDTKTITQFLESL